MNAYEWRQEHRRQRLERAAARAQSEAEGRFTAARSYTAGIPLGQPILVGHHSEKRHRRALERHDRAMRAGFARLKDAEELARRAAAVGTGGISSDDPEAPDKLTDKAAQLTARRDRMKAVNAAYRKHRGAQGWSAGLKLTDAETREIEANFRFSPGCRQPYPAYALSNIGARIRDAGQRVQELHRLTDRAQAGQQDASVNGVRVLTDPADNRVTLTFPRRLTREEYRQVRGHGFLWSPTRDGFTRKLTGGAEAAARILAESFTP